MNSQGFRALACAAVVSIAAAPAHAQIVAPDMVLNTYQPDTLDQFALYQSIHDGRALLSAPARYTGNPPKVYLVDLADGSMLHEFDYFSDDVAMNDDCIAIAFRDDQGSASVAIHDPVTLDLIRVIEIGGNPIMNTGLSIALQGTTLVVGAEDLSANGQNESGVVRVYNALTGDMLLDLTPGDLGEREHFGSMVEIDTDRIYVVKNGSFPAMTGPAIYIFNASTGQLEREIEVHDDGNQPPYIIELAAQDGTIGLGLMGFGSRGFVYSAALINASNAETNIIDAPDVTYELLGFGSEIGLYGDTFVIAGIAYAPADFFGRPRAYVYDRTSLDHVSTLKGSADDSIRETFTLPNALDGSYLHIGAVESGLEGPVGDGRLLAFDLDRCPADLDASGDLDFMDINALITERIDWNDDLAFDYFDLSAYLAHFTDPCAE
jgi:hypothetical protein